MKQMNICEDVSFENFVRTGKITVARACLADCRQEDSKVFDTKSRHQAMSYYRHRVPGPKKTQKGYETATRSAL